MNEITNAQTTTLAPQQQHANPFEAYGNAVAPRMIVGRLLKFSQGFNFQAGQDGVEVPVGTVLAAIMPMLTAGWVKWEGALPTEQIVGSVADGFTPPKRKDLGDTDEAAWAEDESGQRRDPWQLTNYLIMADPKTHELFTFATSSKGGLGAVGELCKTYGKMMRQRPDHIPIVKLDFGSYKPRDPTRSRVKFPILEVIGWTDKQQYLHLLERTGTVEPENATGPAEPETDALELSLNTAKSARMQAMVPRF
jgi:hypothetical protein